MIHDLFWPEIPKGFLTEDFFAFNFNSIHVDRSCYMLTVTEVAITIYVHSQDGMKSGIRKKEHSKMIKAEWDKLVHE